MGCSDSKTASGGGQKQIETILKVEYFGFAHGRADPIRFLLYHAKVDHEYIGYDLEQWVKMKGTPAAGEFGGLPRVTYAGKEYG